MPENNMSDLDFFKHIYTCFDCCYKTQEDGLDGKVYCSIPKNISPNSGKVIDDGFGEGDSTVCEKLRTKNEEDLENWIRKSDDILSGKYKGE